jgi:hypothetical protein
VHFESIDEGRLIVRKRLAARVSVVARILHLQQFLYSSRLSGYWKQVVKDSEPDQVRLVRQTQLVHEVLSVRFDRARTDAQQCGNRSLAQTSKGELQNLTFSRGQDH